MRTTLIHRLPFCWLLGIRAVARGRWGPRGLPPETGCDQADASCCVHLVWCHDINADLYKIIISRVCSRCETPKKTRSLLFQIQVEAPTAMSSLCPVARFLGSYSSSLRGWEPLRGAIHDIWWCSCLSAKWVKSLSNKLIIQKAANKQGTKPNNFLSCSDTT